MNKEKLTIEKAMRLLIKNTLDMGDDYGSIVENVCSDAEMDEKEVQDALESENQSDIALEEAFERISYVNPRYIQDMTDNYCEPELLPLKYEAVNNTKVEDTETYRILTTIKEYLDSHYMISYKLNEIIKYINDIDFLAVKLGTLVSNNYYHHLDKGFGTCTNDCYTVGHIITEEEKLNNPYLQYYDKYGYILHKDINRCGSPKASLCAMFTSKEDMIYIDTILTRRIKNGEAYIRHFGQMEIYKNTPYIKVSEMLAARFNELLPIIYNIANRYPSLYRELNDEEMPEHINDISPVTDDIEVLNTLVSTWTMNRGDKKPASIKYNEWHNEEDYYIIYDNKISEEDEKKINIEYKDGYFTLMVCICHNKVVIYKDKIKMKGRIHENTSNIAEVIGKAMIRN